MPGAPEPPAPRGGHPVLRVLVGCLVALLCSAGIGAVFVLEQVHTLRDAFKQNPAFALPSHTLASAGWGQPETLLLVGDDQRALTKYYHVRVLPHSNEMLLVRIDPSKPFISMMSIPRELETTIEVPRRGPVTTRFNYAYTAGGIPLLVSTIRNVLGLSVNHVMVVTFGRFKRAVDQMGCAYSTVDRRYYHVNVPGGPQYQEIDLQPGYQDMCGTQALEFVSYRHTDTSLVRDARDQAFLLDVKQEYGPTLADNIGKFERIFGGAVQTDSGLQSSTGLLNLIGTLISSAGRRVRQVQFQANLSPPQANTCACVTASAQQIAASVRSFLYGGSAIPKQSVAATARAVHSAHGAAHLPLAPVPSGDVAAAQRAANDISFPYEFPTVEERGGTNTPVYFRDYSISAPDGSSYPIYDAVFYAGSLGQYFDLQGTTWRTATILDGAEQTVTVGGRTYYLHFEGGKLTTVAWQEHGAAYWIHNTLTDWVANGDLLAMAEQTHPISAGSPAARRVQLRAAVIPTHIVPAAPVSMRETIGAIGGLAALIAAPILLAVMYRRRRTIIALEGELEHGFAVESQLLGALPATEQGVPINVHPIWRTPAARGERPPGAPRSRTPLYAGAATLVAAIAIAAGVYVHEHDHHAPVAARRSATRRSTPGNALAGVKVAVLNATTTPGAAHTLAVRLQQHGAAIGTVGNIAQTHPPGLWILYAPGQRAAALGLARLVPGQVATIAPVDPSSQAAAGPNAQVIVVIA